LTGRLPENVQPFTPERFLSTRLQTTEKPDPEAR